MIEISSHKKFIRIEDLINWENDKNKMKVNNKNKLNTIISLLDTHIINELKKVEVNEDKVDTLSENENCICNGIKQCNER